MKKSITLFISLVVFLSSFMRPIVYAGNYTLDICNVRSASYREKGGSRSADVRDIIDRLIRDGKYKIYVSHNADDGSGVPGFNITDPAWLQPKELYIEWDSPSGVKSTTLNENDYIIVNNSDCGGLPPATPKLKYPSDGQLNLPLTITFEWETSLYATEYLIQIYIPGGAIELNWTSMGTNLTKTFTVSKNNTYYKWKIKAKNSSAEAMTEWGFTTGTGGPGPGSCGVPTPIEPTGDWGNVTNPTFKWNAATFASKYKIHLQEYGSFFLKEEEINNTQHSFGTLEPGNYYWYVESLCSIDNQWKRSNTVEFQIYSSNIPILFVHGIQQFHGLCEHYDPRFLMLDLIKGFPGQEYVNKLNFNLWFNELEVGSSMKWKIWESKIDSNSKTLYISNYNKVDINNLNIDHRTTDSIGLFAQALIEEISFIRNREKVKKIDIVAHSMGGLISRAVIECNDFSPFINDFSSFNANICDVNNPPVRNLFTIDTPHHGFGSYETFLTHRGKLGSIFMECSCTREMSPSSRFLNVLNYGINDNLDLYLMTYLPDCDVLLRQAIDNRKSNYDNLNDILNPNVNYYTFSGIYPNKFNRNRLISIGYGSYYDEIYNQPKDTVHFDKMNDGLVQADSARLYSSNVNYYPMLWESHSSIIKDKRSIDLITKIAINNLYIGKNELISLWNDRDFIDMYELLTDVASPVTLSIVDESGNKTGVTQDGLPESIFGSFYNYFDEQITILIPGKYSIQITGQAIGNYGLFSKLNKDEKFINLLNLYTVPINAGNIHLYSLNWDEMNQDPPKPPMVTLQIDENGDGTFESTVNSPYAPTNLSLSYDFVYPANQFNLINLDWEASIPGTNPVFGYNVYRKEIFTTTPDLSDLSDMVKIASTNANTTHYTDATCEPTKIYQYYVEAYDLEMNISPPSESKYIEMKIIPPFDSAILQYPPNGSEDVIFSPNLLISWLPVDEATHYHVRIYRDDTNELIFDNKNNLTTDTYLTIPESILKKLKTYRWNVIAMNTAGTAPISETWYFATEGPDTKRYPLLLVHGQQSFGLKDGIIEYDPRDVLRSLASSMVGVNNDHFLKFEEIPVTATIDGLYREWSIWKVTLKDGTFRQEVYISNYTMINLNMKRYPFPNLSILTYAKYLKAEIDTIRNQQNAYVMQVDVIAHGMGGLVSRTYIESNDFIGFEKAFPDADPTLFDHDEDYPQSVRNLVLINTPNHGLSPSILQKGDYSIQNIKEMVIGSNFLNVLNYGLNDSINHDNLSDRTRPEVQYRLIGSIFFNNKMRDEIGSSSRDKYSNLWYSINSIKLDLYDNYSRYAHPESVNRVDEITDGLLHYDSSQLYPLQSNNVENYPFAWSSYNGILIDQSAHYLIQNLIYDRNLEMDDFIGSKGYWSNGENQYKYLLKSDIQQIPYVAKTQYYYNQTYFSDSFEPNLSILFFNLQNLGFTGQNEVGIIYENNQFCYFSLLDQQVIAFIPGDYGLNVHGKYHGQYALTSILCTDLVSKQFVYDELKPISNISKDEYHLNWEGLRNQDIKHNGTATVITSSDFSIYSDYFCSTPSDPNNLLASLDFDQIFITWEPAKKGTYPIERYEVYRKIINTNSQKKIDFSNFTDLKLVYTHTDLTKPFEFLDVKVYNGVTYQYHVIAIDTHQHKSPSSNLSFAGPVLPKQKPNFDSFSIEPNKMVFTAKEEVLLKIDVINSGNGDSNRTKLLLDIPDEIIYMSCDKYIGKQMHDGSIEFDLGKIKRRSSISFQVNLYIYQNVIFEKTIPIYALLDSSDTDDVRRTINLLVKPKNTSGSNGSPIYVELLNCKHDEETGKPYIDADTELSIKVILSDFTLPYDLKIQWGDGDIFNRKMNSELEFKLTHKFKANGLMTIIITVADSSGKTKSVEFSILVK